MEANQKRMLMPKNMGTYFKPRHIIQKNEWRRIVAYLLGCYEVRKSLCVGCGHGSLYDKNGKHYSVSVRHTLSEVVSIVEEIKKINSEQPEGNSAS